MRVGLAACFAVICIALQSPTDSEFSATTALAHGAPSFALICRESVESEDEIRSDCLAF